MKPTKRTTRERRLTGRDLKRLRGECRDCPRPVAPGRQHCPFHIEAQRLRDARRVRINKGTTRCSACKALGHNARTCDWVVPTPKRKKT